MKRRILTMAICLGVLTSTALYARGGWKQSNTTFNQSGTYSTTSVYASSTELTQEQRDDLIFMYQEEKVARDVYIILGDKWGLNVFDNIQRAEQKHMDAIKTLLINHGIAVPLSSDVVGVFNNQGLQALYDELIEKGLTSTYDALEVGIMVEETDIADLEDKIINAPSDVVSTFNNLLNGSYNHLEAFNNLL